MTHHIPSTPPPSSVLIVHHHVSSSAAPSSPRYYHTAILSSKTPPRYGLMARPEAVAGCREMAGSTAAYGTQASSLFIVQYIAIHPGSTAAYGTQYEQSLAGSPALYSILQFIRTIQQPMAHSWRIVPPSPALACDDGTCTYRDKRLIIYRQHHRRHLSSSLIIVAVSRQA